MLIILEVTDEELQTMQLSNVYSLNDAIKHLHSRIRNELIRRGEF